MTGVAGFIGAEVARQLLDAGIQVIGCDNMNDYYDVRLKEHRLKSLADCEFHRLDIEDVAALQSSFPRTNSMRFLISRPGPAFATVW